jgi:hypothetical protein
MDFYLLKLLERHLPPLFIEQTQGVDKFVRRHVAGVAVMGIEQKAAFSTEAASCADAHPQRHLSFMLDQHPFYLRRIDRHG